MEEATGKLRRKAERILARESGPIRSAGETEILHPLEELEAQNEQLRHVCLVEQQLKNRYIKLYESGPWGCINTDRQGVITWINATALEMLGLQTEELEGRRIAHLIYLDDQPNYLQLLSKIAAGRSHTQSADLRLLKHFKEPLYVELEIRSFPTADLFVGWQLTFLDIHERKLFEEELRRSKEKYSSIFQATGDAIIVFNAVSGRILEANPSACALYGYTPDEMLLLTHLDLAVESAQALQAVSRESNALPSCYHKRQDGTVFPVEISLSYFTQHGRRMSTMVVRDISKRQEAEQSLRESEERFRELAENIQEIFWVMTPQQILYVSPAYEKICGKSRGSLYEDRDSFPELIHPEDKERMRQIYQSHLETMGSFDVECRIIRPDGVMRWVRARSFPIVEQGRAVRSVGIAEDITARKEAEVFLRLERDLAMALGSVEGLQAAMKLLLEGALQLEVLDAGGIYLMESETGSLQLSCQQGLSDELVKQVSRYGPDSPLARFAMQSRPAYGLGPAGILGSGDLLIQEGITALAAIPVLADGQAVALLILASHVVSEIPGNIRRGLDAIAAHIGAIISRIRLGEQLKVQGERLQEANAALKVLLKQRELDRAELEESLLDNVQHLVLPYLEKLDKSRLADEQRFYLDIVASHLKEITSPFVRKLSSQFLGLTPTEIRIAELIRRGWTSKEIAEILVSSERTVLFHRQNLRKKLGINKQKVNLSAYLINLS